jgi:hypothetical protein
MKKQAERFLWHHNFQQLPNINNRNMSTKKLHTGGDDKHLAQTNKGQIRQNHQKGSPGLSKREAGKHEKDESGGSEKNTTKKQQNSI